MIGNLFELSLILLVLVACLGVLVVSTLRKGRWGINLKLVQCPSCVTPMSARRQPMFRSHMLFGGWVCPHCGTRMDKWGRAISPIGTASS
jgi:hypothetical protein